MLDKLTKSIPLFTAAFILFEAVKQVLVYNFYGFKIIPFLTFTDLLNLFLADAAYYIFILTISFLISCLLHFINDHTKLIDKSNKKWINITVPVILILAYLKSIYDGTVIIFNNVYLILIIIWCCYRIIKSYRKKDSFVKKYLNIKEKQEQLKGQKHQLEELINEYNKVLDKAKLIGKEKEIESKLDINEVKERLQKTSKIIDEYPRMKFNEDVKNIRNDFIKIISLSLISTFVVLTLNNLNESNIKKNIQLTSKDDKLLIHKYEFCIGQTTDHYFIYNPITKTTTVINTSDVKEVQISK